MKLSFICPTDYLEKLDTFQDFYLLLPHIAKKDPNYREFFKNNKRYKIMDNSAHELGNSFDFSEVIDLAEELNCQEIVLPDKLFDMKDTLKQSEEGIRKIRKKGLLGRIKIQAVPQGNSYEEYKACLEVFRGWGEIEVIGLAFRIVERCFYKKTGLPGVMPNRLALTDELSKEDEEILSEIEWHLLGLGNVLELYFQKRHKWIRSNDSTKQVKYALVEKFFNHYGCKDKVPGYLDFNKPYHEDFFKSTVNNILVTKDMVK